ncbi:hypothetical protein KAU37_00515 [Candidatus Bipolaricaulota bacterium]|nr:hypothetical protein [Candidatus Bipolaricaulota bacterium]
MRAIITDGTGFVGSHAVCAHINAGNAVLVLDNPFAGHEINLNLQAEFVSLCISERETVPFLFDRFSPQHYATQVNIRCSVADPFFDSEVNVIDTINPLCEAVRAEAMFGFAGRVSLEEGL